MYIYSCYFSASLNKFVNYQDILLKPPNIKKFVNIFRLEFAVSKKTGRRIDMAKVIVHFLYALQSLVCETTSYINKIYRCISLLLKKMFQFLKISPHDAVICTTEIVGENSTKPALLTII